MIFINHEFFKKIFIDGRIVREIIQNQLGRNYGRIHVALDERNKKGLYLTNRSR